MTHAFEVCSKTLFLIGTANEKENLEINLNFNLPAKSEAKMENIQIKPC